MMKSKYLLTVGAIFGGVAVILGAFAAHGLKHQLSASLLDIFHTAVQYQFIHALALVACAILIMQCSSQRAQKYFYRASICFIIGILCFSGSLYALALTGIKWFGPVTPFGGLLFILGWFFLAMGARKLDEVNP
jgi:uncharacterized membrane protein YgdD (TMEM256/DUF423 family)